jgi:hypothetical protein
LTNPSAISFIRINANNTITARSAADFRSDIGAGTGNGTVTSVAVSAGTGISVSGSPITGAGTITVSMADMGISTIKGRITSVGSPQDLTAAQVRTLLNVADGANAYVHPTGFSNQPATALANAAVISQITVNNEGHVTGVSQRNLTAANIGAAPTSHTHTASQISNATTVGQNLMTLTNPSAISFIRINANNTITARSAADFRSDIGAGTGNGTVTSVGSGSGLTGGPITGSGTLAVDSTVIRTTGNQTLGGTKTFSSPVVFSGATSGTITLTATAIAGTTTLTMPATTGTLALTSQIPTNVITGTGSSGHVSFWTGTTTQSGDSNLFWDNTNKRLGVGSSSPTHRLVASSPNFSEQLLVLRSGSTQFSVVEYANSSGTLGRCGYDNSSNFIVRSGTSTATLFQVSSGGNVGIGTTSPNRILHISTASSSIFTLQRTSTTPSAILLEAGSNYTAIYSKDADATSANREFRIFIGSTSRFVIDTSGIATASVGFRSPRYRIQSLSTYGANKTLVASENGIVLRCTASSDTNITVPTGLSSAFSCTIIQDGTGQITFVEASGVTINNRQNHTKTAGQYAIVSLIQTNTNVYILSGDTAP